MKSSVLERIERKLGLKTNRPVFFVSGVFVIVFLVLGTVFGEMTARVFGTLAGYIAHGLGWFYILAVTLIVGFVVWIAASRYGRIRLGPPGSKPDYGNATWFAMLFTAGIGTVLMFYGVAEPLTHYMNSPLTENQTREAAQEAINFSFYHYGPHAWAVFSLVGLSLAYFSFRRGHPLSIRAAFYPLLGKRADGIAGHAIDIFAVLGTIFGVSVSLGLAASQFTAGLDHVTGIGNTPLIQTFVITGITLSATWSVVRGLDGGIRRLGQLNMILALILLAFVFIVGSTASLMGAFVQNTGFYLQNFIRTAFWTEAYRGGGWQERWTLFIWAWQISWAPFVGLFIARISKGRTIREFVMGALIAPALFTFFWFTVFGNTAIDLERGGAGLGDVVLNNMPIALFAMLEQFPLASIVSVIALIVVFLFFVTSSDSGSLVVDMITAGGRTDAPTRQRVFWATTEGAIAAVLLLAGGIVALQNVVTVMGLPFCIILLLMAVSLVKGLETDPEADVLNPPPRPGVSDNHAPVVDPAVTSLRPE